tara:strand:- start:2143 stop:3624 length:1482 start_codon:yes stop_codon:yes gene_type:complete
LENNMGKFVGIDLGTTFSVLSIYNEDGTSEVIYNTDRLLPSVLHFDVTDIVVGINAVRMIKPDPKNVVLQIKKKMPQNHKYSLTFYGKKYTPEDISAEILKKLISDAELKIGKIDNATITVPAFYNDIAREATRNAALKAGIVNPTIINEPVSAALYYSRKTNSNGKFLIYDIGGGTLDCTIAEINGDNVKILANRGDSFGGVDFNNRLLDLINENKIKEDGSPISTDLDLCAKENYEELENYKKMLDEFSDVQITLEGNNGVWSGLIQRSDFHNKIDEYILKSEMIIESLLDETKLEVNQIDGVLLVGGTTRAPIIQSHLKKIMNKDNLITTVNVDEVVSLGASIHCALRNKNEQSKEQKNNLGNSKLTDVVNKYYGTRVINSTHSKRINFVMINKNETYPIAYTHIFKTISDKDLLSSSVTESEISTEDLNLTEQIAQISLEDLGDGRQSGLPIEIKFSINDDMILTCSYKDIKSGKFVVIDKKIEPADSK